MIEIPIISALIFSKYLGSQTTAVRQTKLSFFKQILLTCVGYLRTACFRHKSRHTAAEPLLMITAGYSYTNRFAYYGHDSTEITQSTGTSFSIVVDNEHPGALTQ